MLEFHLTVDAKPCLYGGYFAALELSEQNVGRLQKTCHSVLRHHRLHLS